MAKDLPGFAIVYISLASGLGLLCLIAICFWTWEVMYARHSRTWRQGTADRRRRVLAVARAVALARSISIAGGRTIRNWRSGEGRTDRDWNWRSSRNCPWNWGRGKGSSGTEIEMGIGPGRNVMLEGGGVMVVYGEEGNGGETGEERELPVNLTVPEICYDGAGRDVVVLDPTIEIGRPATT